MGWFTRQQQVSPSPLIPPVAEQCVGVCLTLDQSACILSIASHTPLLASPSQLFWQALTDESANSLSHSLESWLGQIVDVCFVTATGPRPARVWLQQTASTWQLSGVWIDDLVAEYQREQYRRQLLSTVAKGTLAIRQAPSAFLAQTTRELLSTLASLLEVKELAVAVFAQHQWRLYALSESCRNWWLDMAVDSSLQCLAGGEQEGLLVPLELAGQPARALAYPHQRAPSAWLLMSAPPEQSLLRNEDWQLFSAQLACAVLERLEATRAQTQMRRSTLLQQLVEVGWWECDYEAQRVSLAPYLAEKLDVSAELTWVEWFALMHPADGPEFNARLKQLGDALTFSCPVRLKTADGTTFIWFQLQAQRQGQRFGKLHGYLLNIETLKQQQAQTALAHARLSRLVAEAPAVIYLESCQQGALRLSFASQSLEPLLGWRLPDLAEGKLAEKIHPEDLDTFFARSRALLAAGHHRCKYRIQDQQGAYHWLLDEANVLRDEQGVPQEVVGIWLDVTEATLASERIRESEERYRALVEDSPAMICRYAPDLTFRFANQPMAKCLQVTPAELLGANFAQWLSAEQQAQFAERIGRMSPEQPVVSSEICLSLPGCDNAWWVWVERGIFNDDGTLSEIQAVGRDNTQVRKTQQQLNQSAKMATLGEMATGMAHEMNQPLHVMNMAIANVQKRLELGNLAPDYLSEKLQRISLQVKRAARLVDHMRVFGRRSAIEPQPFNPQTCVYEAAALLDESLKTHQVGVLISCGTEHAKVNGHADQLEQVLINLLVNAKDALLARRAEQPSLVPHIELETIIDAEHVWIFVQDNGGGIEEKLLERIFDPFFTTKEVGKGTGLGLSVSYSIIKQMGGQLSVENQGAGARFCIELPRFRPQH